MRTRAWSYFIATLVLGAAFSSAQTGCDPNVFYQVCTSTLPTGNLETPYEPVTLVASIGYEGTNVWSLASGQLPAGLTLGSDGTISGTPTAAGLFSFTVQADQAGTPPLSAQAQLSIFIIGSLAITTSSLPNGTVGVPYQAPQLAVTGGYSGVPTTWSIGSVGDQSPPGSLPLGLTLSSDGNITGVPNTPGTYTFSVEADQADPQYPLIAYQSLTIVIYAPPLQIATPSLPNGAVGVAYSQTFTTSNGSTGGTQSWSLIGGSLPSGLALSKTGVLSGTPTSAGSYTFLIQVVDQMPAGGSNTAIQAFTVQINAAPASLLITTGASLPSGTVGAVYAQQISATGGAPAYTWALDNGALPGGLGLDTTSGLISGTPAAAGDYTFQLSVTDQLGGKATRAFTLTINPGLSITTASPLPGGVAGTPYSTTLAAAGGTLPYTWSVTAETGGVPAGLTLDSATGKLSGTPTTAGSYQFTAVVSDAAQHRATKPLSITIETPLAITTPSPLPDGTVGKAYQLQLAATGGTQAYTWSLTAGALPAGITLDPAAGMLAGTPTAAGVFNLTLGVTDGVQSLTKAFKLTIAAPPLPAVIISGLPDTGSPATQPPLVIGLSTAYGLDLTGHATLTFTPTSTVDDPAVQFTSGGRTADFTIPAGTTQAVFGSSALGVQTGTVAGTITITLQLFAAGADVTPTPAPTKVITIAASAPVITSAKLTSTSTGFNLVVIGYSTLREVTGSTVHLTAASGQTLATSDFTIPLTSVFSPYYQDPNNARFGSQFSLTIPFTVQSATSAIASATVTLTNTQGTSAAANATF